VTEAFEFGDLESYRREWAVAPLARVVGEVEVGV
jgi:hypothetical protein